MFSSFGVGSSGDQCPLPPVQMSLPPLPDLIQCAQEVVDAPFDDPLLTTFPTLDIIKSIPSTHLSHWLNTNDRLTDAPRKVAEFGDQIRKLSAELERQKLEMNSKSETENVDETKSKQSKSPMELTPEFEECEDGGDVDEKMVSRQESIECDKSTEDDRSELEDLK